MDGVQQGAYPVRAGPTCYSFGGDTLQGWESMKRILKAVEITPIILWVPAIDAPTVHRSACWVHFWVLSNRLLIKNVFFLGGFVQNYFSRMTASAWFCIQFFVQIVFKLVGINEPSLGRLLRWWWWSLFLVHNLAKSKIMVGWFLCINDWSFAART